MNLIDKLYSELEATEYKIDQHIEGEVELSELGYGIEVGKKSILDELIEMVENGTIQ